ncbi:hypothetical protein SAMN05421773_102240 [Streptomyces aidingensis]|uniref:Uncharacterized protein n=2 Tax=Streptomyces aidingensis TaxID=910347 RepID=A0A1I1H477_9ACTN|nr:hypothetical protein SAMN05421773_102240 [Streptomyces aidingensis]
MGTYPCDLEVREQLAHVYRLLGEPAQAGRWNYLSELRDPHETAAFEALFPSPRERLWSLRWAGSAEELSTPTAAARLRSLHAAAERDCGESVPYRRPRPGRDGDGPKESPFAGAACAVGCLALLALLVTGLATVVDAVLG